MRVFVERERERERSLGKIRASSRTHVPGPVGAERSAIHAGVGWWFKGAVPFLSLCPIAIAGAALPLSERRCSCSGRAGEYSIERCCCCCWRCCHCCCPVFSATASRALPSRALPSRALPSRALPSRALSVRLWYWAGALLDNRRDLTMKHIADRCKDRRA